MQGPPLISAHLRWLCFSYGPWGGCTLIWILPESNVVYGFQKQYLAFGARILGPWIRRTPGVVFMWTAHSLVPARLLEGGVIRFTSHVDGGPVDPIHGCKGRLGEAVGDQGVGGRGAKSLRSKKKNRGKCSPSMQLLGNKGGTLQPFRPGVIFAINLSLIRFETQSGRKRP